MKRRITYPLLFIASFVTLLVFLFFVSPEDLPLYALFVPFIAIFIMSYLVVKLVASTFLKNLSGHARQVFTVAMSALPVVLLILQSSGQMSGSDVWLFALLAVLLFFYLRKADFLK